MKGVVFTLDALFGLAIAILAISVLLFFQYYNQVPYALSYSNAQVVLSNLASATVESLQNSSALAKSIANQFLGANETSPQFLGGPQRNASNFVGPSLPILVYTYNPGNTITTSVVADYGNFYFAANSILYAVNATTNKTAWTKNTLSNVVSTPALYSGMLIYANSTNLTAVSARTGAVIWSTSTIATFTPVVSAISAYDNKVIFGGSDNNIHAYYANNGTSLWSSYSTTLPVSLTALRGSVIERTSGGLVATVAQTGSTANQLISKTYAASNFPTNNIAGSGTVLYFGTASYANATYTNGTVVTGFPVSLLSTVTGVAAYKGYIVYQTSNSVVALRPNGAQSWSVVVPSSYGAALTNATPLVSGSMVYTLWANGLAAENLTTGTIKWSVLIQNANIAPYMTLAYGRLYVVANNRVLTYGSCNSPLHASVLSAAATMYLNSQIGCGSALLNSAYPPLNYTLFAGNPTTNTIQAASFTGVAGVNGGNYITANVPQVNGVSGGYNTVSFWMYWTGSVQEFPFAFPDSPTDGLWFQTQSCFGFNDYTANVYGFNAVGLINKWTFVTAVFYNGAWTGNSLLYVNGVKQTLSQCSGVASTMLAHPTIDISFNNWAFNGQIANVQIYNKTLTSQQITQLYLRGVQSVPLRNSGLAAWYPLAGDINDYAFFNTGYAPNGLKFVTSTYAPQALSNAYQISRASTLLPVLNTTNGVTNTVKVGVYSWS